MCILLAIRYCRPPAFIRPSAVSPAPLPVRQVSHHDQCRISRTSCTYIVRSFPGQNRMPTLWTPQPTELSGTLWRHPRASHTRISKLRRPTEIGNVWEVGAEVEGFRWPSRERRSRQTSEPETVVSGDGSGYCSPPWWKINEHGRECRCVQLRRF